MNLGSLLGVPLGGGSSGGGVLLSTGRYWFDGDATLMLPIEGVGWLTWDGVTDKQASGNSVSWCHVNASAWQPTTATGQASWKGDLAETYLQGNASAMVAMLDIGANPANHPFYATGQVLGLFTSSSNVAQIAVYTQSDGSGGNILLEAGAFSL